jgi:hypothetical protein
MALTRTTVQGRYTTDTRTAAMIAEAEKLGGPLTVTQGSYNTTVAASAGTHNGGGCIDFSVRGLTLTQINKRVRALRIVGFAAWHRFPSEGPWPEHIHAVAVGCKELAAIAARQVASLRAGRNGLASNGLDRHRDMKLPVTTWEAYLASKQAAAKPAVKAVVIDLSDVLGTLHAHGTYVGPVATALVHEGLPANKTGYAKWQQRCGVGKPWDGVAGIQSLTKLGAKYHFTVKQ